MPEFFIARLKRKPGKSPALLPTMPLRLGPAPLLPSTLWQAAHCEKTCLPASTSCACAANVRAIRLGTAQLRNALEVLSVMALPFFESEKNRIRESVGAR